ncbi:NADPH:quinone reductase [candidate division KSB1 bacterium]|nr:NADPH:quinone reductase [candidate division KSB1 bacterium]
MKKKMKIARYHGFGAPKVIGIEEADVPEPGKNHVRIRVEANALNPIDGYLRLGLRPVELPVVPHFDYSGVIEKAGAGVKRWRIGDRVWGTRTRAGLQAGAAAEYIIEREDSVFAAAPGQQAAESAALAMVSLTAHLALFAQARAIPGERVLITGGSGGVGRAAIQLARHHGLQIISTASTTEKAREARRAGAHEVVETTSENLIERVRDWSADEGVEIILELSTSENLQADLQMIRNRGRIVTIGSPRGTEPKLPWLLLNRKNAAVLGVLVFTMPHETLRRAGKEISHLTASGHLHAHIGARLPFSDIVEAHRLLDEGQTAGRIVVEMG